MDAECKKLFSGAGCDPSLIYEVLKKIIFESIERHFDDVRSVSAANEKVDEVTTKSLDAESASRVAVIAREIFLSVAKEECSVDPWPQVLGEVATYLATRTKETKTLRRALDKNIAQTYVVWGIASVQCIAANLVLKADYSRAPSGEEKVEPVTK